MTRFFFFILAISLTFNINGQKPVQLSSVDLYNKVQKLNVVGSVLYLAAHPDDENTRLISYFANERKVRTAYLSLTRGDGGQNLIGTEIWEKLGLIRTNELLMARSIDGGTQYFSRANDFGYSKHPDETLSFWNKKEVMHDIIKVIREFKPDIIVNRFDHRTPGQTHGHHTSSAMLSVEAFDIANDANQYGDRLSYLGTWQPKRVFFNTSWWFYGGQEQFEKADKSKLSSVDAGTYYPTRGLSNTEIASRSRSMHKSQGFGSTGTRGSEMEFLELIKGSAPSSKEDPLSGLNLTWSRVEGGEKVQAEIDKLIQNYNFVDPSQNVSQLINIYKTIEQIDDNHWRVIKLEELKEIIIASAGIFLESVSKSPYGVNGDNLSVGFEMINRSSIDVNVKRVAISGGNDPIDLNISLFENERKNLESTFTISDEKKISNPYWLNEKGSIGMYTVADVSRIGDPVSPSAYTTTFELDVQGLALSIVKDLVYKTNSPVDGEVYSPFYVLPRASVKFSDPVYIFPDRTPKDITVVVKSYRGNFKGILSLELPSSWSVSPKIVEIEIPDKGDQRIVNFSIIGPYLSESAEIAIRLLEEGGSMLTNEVTEIKYDHIPFQVLSSPARAKVERLSLQIRGKNIAYLQGAGDDIPKNLRQIGYNVQEIEVSDLTLEKLKSFDALVLGIRAYNTQKELFLKQEILQNYMESGGNVIVQYNTNRGIKGTDIAPYPIDLSRERVTDENAGISFEDASHEILNYPNKISSKDFDGWVQERGLYFPDKWDDKYASPISCSDSEEPLLKGGLLIAPVGKGHFIYTGYSWFRQLPAGVSGAFRIFANMLSVGKNPEVINATKALESNE